MAVTLRDSTSGSDASGTSKVLSRPSGTQTGDLLIAFIVLSDEVVGTAPAGWNKIMAFGETPGNDSGQMAWWRIAAGGDPSTWTFTTGNFSSIYGISAWSGHDPDRPVDALDIMWGNNTDAVAPATTARRGGVAIYASSKAINTGTLTLPGSLTSLIAYTSPAADIAAVMGYKAVTAGGVGSENFGNPGNFDHLSSVLVINEDYSPTLLPDASAFSSAVLALSPAAYWRLADQYGLTADDSAGSNDGTITGYSALTYAPPIFPGLPASMQLGAPSASLTNGVVRPAASSAYVSLPSTNWWSSTPDVYTIMACMKPFDVGSGRQTIFGASGTAGKPQIEVEADGSLDMIVEGAFRWDSAAATIANNTAYFIVFTRNGSGNTFHVYLNGSEITDAAPSTTSQTSGAFVGLIGARTTTTQAWNGYISDVALFTTALSSANASNLYALLTGTPSAGEPRFAVPAIIG